MLCNKTGWNKRDEDWVTTLSEVGVSPVRVRRWKLTGCTGAETEKRL